MIRKLESLIGVMLLIFAICFTFDPGTNVSAAADTNITKGENPIQSTTITVQNEAVRSFETPPGYFATNVLPAGYKPPALKTHGVAKEEYLPELLIESVSFTPPLPEVFLSKSWRKSRVGFNGISHNRFARFDI